MLTRTWCGSTSDKDAQNYVDYLRKTGLRAFAATAGNAGAIGLRRLQNGRAEFLLVSLWDSQKAIEGFAGPHPDRAVFYPDDERFLLEREDHVDHFEVVYLALPRRSPLHRLWRWWFNRWSEVLRDVPERVWRLAAFR